MEKQKITKSLIITTAQTMIQETQQTEISLSKIAEALDVTHAAIYKHFDNKQALWTAVCKDWFMTHIIGRIDIDDAAYTDKTQWLHDYLWAFVNAKRETYQSNKVMFDLNTRYIDKDPFMLREVLTPCYVRIQQQMGYDVSHIEKAEVILSAFATFTLPMFKDTWHLPDYAHRFEMTFNLIKQSV